MNKYTWIILLVVAYIIWIVIYREFIEKKKEVKKSIINTINHKKSVRVNIQSQEDLLNQASSLLKKGNELMVNEQYMDALKCFNNSIEIILTNGINATKLYNGYYLRSSAHFKLDNHKSAISDLKRCIELNPKFLDGLITLTKIYLFIDDIDNAKRVIDVINIRNQTNFYEVDDLQYMELRELKDSYYLKIGL